jgi:hypothetical protein
VWPFRRRHFLRPEDEDWLLEIWAYFLRNLGGIDDLRLSPIVTPSREFFPPTSAKGHARAEHVFACVRQHARLEDWHCKLAAQPERPKTRVGEYLVVKHDTNESPLGTFGVDGNEVLITYDPASVDNTFTLVATLAHELAHYLLGSVREEPPGGEDLHEFATDLMTIYLGFGIFGANSAFNFRQHGDFMSQGWQSAGQGYLGEREWAFGLAMFLELRNDPSDTLREFLKPHIMADVQKARRYLRDRPEQLDAIRSNGSDIGSGSEPDKIAEPR